MSAVVSEAVFVQIALEITHVYVVIHTADSALNETP
jgi:hypothetical protein